MTKEDLLYLYFSNSLTSEQEEVFYGLLEKDEAFKAQFEFEKNLKQVIEHQQSETLKAKLQRFENDLNKTSSSIFSYTNFAIAASIAILVGWFGYNSFFGTDYNDLYHNNFSEYPNTVYTITRGDTNNSLEREAFVAYESKDYRTAIAKFDAVDTSAQKNYFNFYKAQAYLGLEDVENAKILFNIVIKENGQFLAESTWYLALIHLKEKEKDLAIANLKKLLKDFNYNREKAQKLLDELN